LIWALKHPCELLKNQQPRCRAERIFMKLSAYVSLISLLGLTLSGGSAKVFAQDAAGSLSIRAEIIQPMTLNCTTRSLDFGAVIPGASGGTVKIPVSGTPTYGGTTAKGAGAPTAGQCTIDGGEGAGYGVRFLSPGTTLTNARGDTMTVNNLVISDGTSPAMGVYESQLDGKAKTLTIGGDLVVSAGQKPGAYNGSISVVAEYE
jgi:hypothetical protein